jgi:phosphoglycerol transferase MdoB-like AlkP superfamily enzyme
VHLPYKRAGYQTRFLYGGKLGWRQLGSYLQGQGWDVLEGAEHLIDKMNLLNLKESERGNEWGIFDEFLFKYVQDELARATTPQFFLVLTTSNHPPFETPSSFKPSGLTKISPELMKLFNKPQDEVLMRFRTVQYANRHLGNFISQVKEGTMKDRVVIAATGDHGFWIGKDEGKVGMGKKYGVPFYVYLPAALKPATWDPQNWGSHIDIMPTLYERTLSNQEYWSFGQDMFAARGAALNAYGIAMDKSGAWISGKSYCWTDVVGKILAPCEPTTELKLLQNYERAQIGLTDEFLRATQSGQISVLP